MFLKQIHAAEDKLSSCGGTILVWEQDVGNPELLLWKNLSGRCFPGSLSSAPMAGTDTFLGWARLSTLLSCRWLCVQVSVLCHRHLALERGTEETCIRWNSSQFSAFEVRIYKGNGRATSKKLISGGVIWVFPDALLALRWFSEEYFPSIRQATGTPLLVSPTSICRRLLLSFLWPRWWQNSKKIIASSSLVNTGEGCQAFQ